MAVVGLGSEIIECVRIARMIERHGETFLERVYTSDEIGYCSERVAATQHYAARWAAKEAVLRSLGFRRSGGVRWTDIEIVFDESQRFRAELDGEIFRQAEAREIDEILISLAHCRSYATATAIAQTL
jgi:holo-[acyl-carrier protein] synthase